jgi:hypothetical protein
MKGLILLLVLAVAGCSNDNGTITFSEEGAAAARESEVKRGVARQALFRECMELAAKMPRQADDDVSDVVQECSTQAYYMTNFIK